MRRIIKKVPQLGKLAARRKTAERTNCFWGSFTWGIQGYVSQTKFMPDPPPLLELPPVNAVELWQANAAGLLLQFRAVETRAPPRA